MGLFTDLKRLELQPYLGKESNVSALSSSLAGLVSLEHLVMGSIGLSTEDANSMLSNLTALQHLDLNCNDLTSGISPALAALKALTHLDLGGNDLWGIGEGVASISSSLALLTGLRCLDLEGDGVHGVRGDAAAKVAALAHSLPQSLTSLSLAHNGIGAAGILAFSPGLQRLTALCILDLSNNMNNTEEAFAAALRATGRPQAMPALEHLYAGCNKLGSRSAKALAACLKHTPNLKSLDLYSAKFRNNQQCGYACSQRT